MKNIKNIIILSLVIMFQACLCYAAEVIVDDADNALDKKAEFTGVWVQSSSVPGANGGSYRHNENSGLADKRAIFTTNLQDAGTYEVYISYTYHPNRATNVSVDIVYANGTTTKTVNQRSDTTGARWESLGQYAFNAGAAVVTIRTAGTDGYVVADAIKFVPPGAVPVSNTYYIDYETGADTNNGLSKASAWKKHPFMQGFAGSYTHQSGDKFIFKGGVVWPNECFSLIIGQGGASGVPDYYGVDSTWPESGWSRPVFDMEEQATTGTDRPVYIYNQSNIVIDNIEIRRQAIVGTYTWARGGITVYQSANIVIQNCYLHDWKVLQPYVTSPNASPDGEFGGITIYNTPGAIVDHCVIHGYVMWSDEGWPRSSGTGIRNAGITSNCEIYDTTQGILGGGTIHDNHIYKIHLSYDGGTNAITPPNGCHPNGVYIFGSVDFYNNYVHDIDSWIPVVYPNAGWGGRDGTVKIYNNVIRGHISIDPEGKNSSTVDIYHIYNNIVAGYNSAVITADRPVVPIKKLYIKNNIFITTGTWPSAVNLAVGADDLQVDNNIYYTPNSDSVLSYPGHGRLSLAQSQALGYNLNSSLASSPIDYTYRPASSSDRGVDQGTDLSAYFTTDKVGVLRPQGATWDIGPYEYDGSGSEDKVSPSVPSGVAASNITQTSIQLSWSASTDNVGVTGYKVYRNNSLIASPASTSYTDTGLTAYTAYNYQVSAVDAAGNESAKSAVLSVTTLAIKYNLNLIAVNGSITALPEQPAGGYDLDTTVQLIANPNPGYHFTSWSGDLSGSDSQTLIIMSADKTITADFAINTYVITASAGAGGTISPSGSATVNYNGSKTFTITPNAGYKISDVIVDNVSVGAVSTYTFSNITDNHTISASFAVITPPIPAAPTNLTATAISGRKITLTWVDNSSNESGFKIERSTDGTTFSRIKTVGANVKTFTNTGLTSGRMYYYRVRAYNSAGNSDYSNTASATARR